MKKEVLQVYFPTPVLRSDAKLLNPSNTDSTYEYYLLENLGIGLLRDDPSSLNVYQPALALDWQQKDSVTWVFKMRPDLFWSDGTPMTPKQVIENFGRLKRDNSRHIAQLKTIKKIVFDENNWVLTLVFNQPTNRGILHELSLADAVVLHPTNLITDWQITSGPYFVDKYDSQSKELILKINKHCPLYSKDAPAGIRLFGFQNAKEELPQLFKTIKVHLMGIPAFSFRNIYQNVEKNAPKIIRGEPILIYYFAFNENNPLGKDRQTRREFASLVQDVFKTVRFSNDIHYENQMIPVGYSGRLKEYEPIPLKLEKLKNQTLILNLYPAFKEKEGILEAFRQKALENHVNIVFHFSGSLLNKEEGKDAFAFLSVFTGNQRDSLGSWSFLFSGAMKQFKHEVEPLFEKIISASEDSEKSDQLKILHKTVLDNTYIVPFMVETSKVATDGSINLSRWNPFDMRMRFYEIRWQ